MIFSVERMVRDDELSRFRENLFASMGRDCGHQLAKAIPTGTPVLVVRSNKVRPGPYPNSSILTEQWEILSTHYVVTAGQLHRGQFHYSRTGEVSWHPYVVLRDYGDGTYMVADSEYERKRDPWGE